VASAGNNNGSKVDEVFQMAVDAVNRGETGKGKAALAWVLDQDPNYAAAWLWLACCLQDDEAKQNCYRRASAISSSG
jgi:Tfp pilus assembly protein PilF